MASASYTAEHITVLEGLEPVRRRPGMYIGGIDSKGYHHLLWEIVDNAVDEAINGFADLIEVTLQKDSQTVTVDDNGRGIPVDIMPKFRKPALEIVFTTLHAGGKFDSGTNYKHSGGLHGVGSSVVCALAESMVVRVRREGKLYEQTFARGKTKTKLKSAGKAKGHGTEVTFKPDEEIFGAKIHFDPKLIKEVLEAKTYLHKGLRVTFRDQTSGETHEFSHEGGIADYLAKVVGERGKGVTTPTPFVLAKANGVRLEIAMTWTESTEESVRSYVNGIPTGSGGTHENGLRSGLVKAVRNYMDTHNLSPKGVTLTADDIREGMTGVLSVFIKEPQFQGQTKDRLNNPELVSAVDAVVRPALEHWLNHNISVAEAIVARIILA